MTSVESGSDAPALADKLSALVARTQRPATVEAAVATAGPSLSDIAGELLSELGDLRAQIAAVGDEATEASGRSNNRAHEIADTIGRQGDAAERRATRVEERLDALEAKVEGFALDLSASLRAEGQRVEASLRLAIEEAALVLAETLLTALPAAAPATVAAAPAPAVPVVEPVVPGPVLAEAAHEEPADEEPAIAEPVDAEVIAEPLDADIPADEPDVEEPSAEAQAEVLETEVIADPSPADEPIVAEVEAPAPPRAPASFTTPAPAASAQGRFFGRSRR